MSDPAAAPVLCPTIEQRLDALGVPRQPRVTIQPGILFGDDGPSVVLECASCHRRDRWLYLKTRGEILCACQLQPEQIARFERSIAAVSSIAPTAPNIPKTLQDVAPTAAPSNVRQFKPKRIGSMP